MNTAKPATRSSIKRVCFMSIFSLVVLSFRSKSGQLLTRPLGTVRRLRRGLADLLLRPAPGRRRRERFSLMTCQARPVRGAVFGVAGAAEFQSDLRALRAGAFALECFDGRIDEFQSCPATRSLPSRACDKPGAALRRHRARVPRPDSVGQCPAAGDECDQSPAQPWWDR